MDGSSLWSMGANQSVTKLGLERISEYIRFKFLTQMNIRIYSHNFFDTKEYPNIFV